MIRKFVTRLRQYGALETTFLGLRWAGLIAEVHSLEFFIRDLQHYAPRPVTSHPKSKLAYSELTARDLMSASLADGLPTREWAQAQFARGSRLFVAQQEDETVAWSWYNTETADLAFIRKPAVVLPDGCAYSHGVIVAPAYQGLAIGGVLKSFGCSRLASEGVRHVVAAVFLSNHRAIHWHADVLRESYWGRITHVRVNSTDRWLKFIAKAGRRHANLFDAHRDACAG